MTDTWTAPAVREDTELRDHLAVDEWRVAIEAIAAQHDLPAAAAAPFPTGSDVVWSVGDAVVKLTDPQWDWQIEAEARWLRTVQGTLSVGTPEVLAHGTLAGWPYVVMSRLPGFAIAEVWPGLTHAERARLARALGALTRELHRVPVAEEAGAWERFTEECRATLARRHSEPEVATELAAAVEPFLASVGPLAHEPHVLLHTELVDQHVFVEERDGRWELSGLIDFADARVGPAPYDFPAVVEFILRGEAGLLREYLLGYGYEPDALHAALPQELLAWGLLHRYGRLKRALAAAGGELTSLSELARRLYGVGA